MGDGPVHCVWCHPWVDGPGFYKQAKQAMKNKPVNDLCSFMTSASAPAQSLSTDLFHYHVGLGTLKLALWTFISACNLTLELAQSLENSPQLIFPKLGGTPTYLLPLLSLGPQFMGLP